MIAYRYDETTKEFLGTQPAQLDPLESKKKGKNIYLLPANCTFIKPMEPQENKAIVFENNEWVLKNDYRGKQAYNQTGFFIINYIGDLRQGDNILTQSQIQGLLEGTLIFKDGEIVKYVKPVKEQIQELENQIEILNGKILRDLIILTDTSATAEEKQDAQSYFDIKKQQKAELIRRINELKNNIEEEEE